MKFTLTIKTDNAAFSDNKGLEVARILRETADRAENGYTEMYLVDYNGNKVGFAEYTVTANEEFDSE